MAVELALTGGGKALVDDHIYPIVSKWKWQKSTAGYPVKGIHRYGAKYINLPLHRFVGAIKYGIIPDGYFIDHIDGNKLNSLSDNLRLCTRAQNQWNRKKNKNSSSKYKGVTWNKRQHKWFSKINKDKKRFSLGYFTDEKEAAKAYNKMALKLYGRYAKINKF